MKIDWDKVLAWSFMLGGWVFVLIFVFWTIR
jgi:hypothetical protein